MKKIIETFSKQYQNTSYETQGRAKILLFTIIFLIPILILFIILLNVTMKREMVSLTNLILFVFIGMLICCIFLMFRGYYNLTSNIMSISLFLGNCAIILKTMTYGSVARFIASAIPLGPIVILSILFCKRPIYITLFIIALFLFPFLAVKSELFTSAEMGSVAAGWGLLIIVSSLLSFLIIRINVLAKRRRSKESEDIRSEQRAIIRSLIESLNLISENLDISSLKMTVESNNLADNLSKQAATTEQITATIEEISAGLESVNNNVCAQDELVNELMVGMDTLSEINSKIEERVVATKNRSLGITEKAEKGEVMLNEMNSSMNEINITAQEMAGILNIINDISDKINLLSLNASIEAARAGEHGRGFAVVADEIGKLADQTSQSVKEISVLINKSEAEIRKGMDNVSGTVKTISEIIMGFGEINQMVNNISQKMKEQIISIRESTKRSEILQEKSNQIKTATEEQKQGAIEISNSINYVNELSQSNAQSSHELTANSSKIEDMSHDVNEKIKSLNLKDILAEIK